MQQNRIHFIQVTANTYQIIEDTNENSANNAGAGDDTIINRALQYPLLAFPAAITMNTRVLLRLILKSRLILAIMSLIMTA